VEALSKAFRRPDDQASCMAGSQYGVFFSRIQSVPCQRGVTYRWRAIDGALIMQSRLVRRLIRFHSSSMARAERLCRRALPSSNTWQRSHCHILPSKAPHKRVLPFNLFNQTPYNFLTLAYSTLSALRQKLTWPGTSLSQARPSFCHQPQ
jgi:hypothetical protein